MGATNRPFQGRFVGLAGTPKSVNPAPEQPATRPSWKSPGTLFIAAPVDFAIVRILPNLVASHRIRPSWPRKVSNHTHMCFAHGLEPSGRN